MPKDTEDQLDPAVQSILAGLKALRDPAFDAHINARVAHHTRDLKPERVTHDRTGWRSHLELLSSEVSNVERPDLAAGAALLHAKAPRPTRRDAISRMLHVHFDHNVVRNVLTRLAEEVRGGTFDNSVPLPGCPTLSVALRGGCPVYAVVQAEAGDHRLNQAWQALVDLGLEPGAWEFFWQRCHGIPVRVRES